MAVYWDGLRKPAVKRNDVDMCVSFTVTKKKEAAKSIHFARLGLEIMCLYHQKGEDVRCSSLHRMKRASLLLIVSFTVTDILWVSVRVMPKEPLTHIIAAHWAPPEASASKVLPTFNAEPMCTSGCNRTVHGPIPDHTGRVYWLEANRTLFWVLP